ncbi:TetR/AcrR family transcriptional regulator [Consotaella aegiceratis]|uniref:TetR/AcrR family transcriptional regulator n=1 Tax=Consotaella aegiceratis TaxID=3097961 RepID=UPI002F3F099D
MPRVIKHPEIRRAEIMDQAFWIFLEYGYENTSLNDVISRAGMSKGMFYHHFVSKEDLLAALSSNMTDATYKAIEPVLTEEGVDPKTRLQNILDYSAESRLQSVEVTRSPLALLLRPENRVLYQCISEAWAECMRPVIAGIVREGHESGVFDTSDPDGVAFFILQAATDTKSLVLLGMQAKTAKKRDEVAEALALRIAFHGIALSRILGLPDDGLTICPPDFAQRFLQGLNPVGLSKRRKRAG